MVRNLLTIWRRELAACFLSPIAYVTMVAFLGLSGWIFLQAAETNSGSVESLEVLLFMSIFFWIPILTTVISMRLFAEENRSGSIEALMTAPVTDLDVVLGKYAGGLSFLFIAVFPSVGFIFLLQLFSPGITFIDVGGIWGGCVGLVLISAATMAIGTLVSLLTRNQIVAAICTLCAAFGPFFIKPLVSVLPIGSEKALDYLSIETHIMDFARGSIDTRPLVLYVSFTVLLLFITVRVLEIRRWK